jgi:hypothetical protein
MLVVNWLHSVQWQESYESWISKNVEKHDLDGFKVRGLNLVTLTKIMKKFQSRT